MILILKNLKCKLAYTYECGGYFPTSNLEYIKEAKRLTKNGNGNGRRRLFDPVLIFIRLIQGFWERRDLVNGETTIVDDQPVF